MTPCWGCVDLGAMLAGPNFSVVVNFATLKTARPNLLAGICLIYVFAERAMLGPCWGYMKLCWGPVGSCSVKIGARLAHLGAMLGIWLAERVYVGPF